MKIISIFVSTLDGKITKGDLPPGYWASQEDQTYFRETIHKSTLIVMGSGTFDPTFVAAHAGILRIVLTHTPEKYKEYERPGQIEFMNVSPVELVSQLEKRGYKTMLLVAGPKVTTGFFKQHLVDELWITIEPKLFGNGKQILTEEMQINLRLLTIEKFNQSGTLLLKYQILK